MLVEIFDELKKLNVKVDAGDCVKLFVVGEGVRIIAGMHAGESGIIASILNQLHAVVILDEGMTEIKILLSNLQKKEC